MYLKGFIWEHEKYTRNQVIAAFWGVSDLYARSGHMETAEEAHQKVIAYYPDYAWGYGNYAEFLLYKKGDYETSISYARRALALMNYGAARSTLSAALFRKWAELKLVEGQLDSAQQYYDEAMTIYPNVANVVRAAKSSEFTELTVIAFQELEGVSSQL